MISKKILNIIFKSFYNPIFYLTVFFCFSIFITFYCALQTLCLDVPFQKIISYQQEIWKYSQTSFFNSYYFFKRPLFILLYPLFKMGNAHPLILPLVHSTCLWGGVLAWILMIKRLNFKDQISKRKFTSMLIFFLIFSNFSWVTIKSHFQESDLLFFIISWSLAFIFEKKEIKILSISIILFSSVCIYFLKDPLHRYEKNLLISPFLILLLSYPFLKTLSKNQKFYTFFLSGFILSLIFYKPLAHYTNKHSQVQNEVSKAITEFKNYFNAYEEMDEVRHYLQTIPSELSLVVEAGAGVWAAHRTWISPWPYITSLPNRCPEMIVVKYANKETITKRAVLDIIYRCQSSKRELELNSDLKNPTLPFWKKDIWSSFSVVSTPIKSDIVHPQKKKKLKLKSI